MKILIILYLLVLAIFGCNVCSSQPQNWSHILPNIGTMPSPRTADLNGDGIKDIVLGAGKAEFQGSDSAIVALNGKNGELLWTNSARDQIFISPGFLDINKDDTQDI